MSSNPNIGHEADIFHIASDVVSFTKSSALFWHIIITLLDMVLNRLTCIMVGKKLMISLPPMKLYPAYLKEPESRRFFSILLISSWLVLLGKLENLSQCSRLNHTSG